MNLNGFVEHVKQRITDFHPIKDFPLVIKWSEPKITLKLLNECEKTNLRCSVASGYGTRSMGKDRVILRMADAFDQLKKFRNLPCAIVIYKNTPDLDEEDMAEVAFGDYRYELDLKTRKFVRSYFANNQTFSKEDYFDLSAIVLAKRIEDDSIEKVKFTVYNNPTKPLPKEFFDQT